jgi:hypothetical protein
LSKTEQVSENGQLTDLPEDKLNLIKQRVIE